MRKINGGGKPFKIYCMHIFKRVFLVLVNLVFIILGMSSCRVQKYFNVNRVDMPLDTFTFKTNVIRYSREDYYFVRTNITHSDTLSGKLDEFVKANISDSTAFYDQYVIYFYKSTPALNPASVSAYSSNNRYKAFRGIKPLSTYTWHKGKINEVERGF